jgi:hypothetical protein
VSGGYSFDPEAAKRVEKGLKDAIAELEEVGYFSITSQQGYGFSLLSMSGMAVGNSELASVFEEFCDRWDFAVKEKIHDANQLAQGLGLNAGLYHEQEEYVVGSLKELAATGASNNPADGMSASEGAADKSWGQIGQEASQKAVQDKPADYSLPDFDELGKQWEQVGDDGAQQGQGSQGGQGGQGDGEQQSNGGTGTR